MDPFSPSSPSHLSIIRALELGVPSRVIPVVMCVKDVPKPDRLT